MDIDIKKHIIDNFKESSIEDMKLSINESIASDDEVVLPGLGVFFELLWENSNEEMKQNILRNIKKGI